MEIREMLVDAAKYPLSGWKQLLILGVMILIISEIIAHNNDLNINLPSTVTLLLSVAIIALITILGFLEAGYTFKIIEKSLKGIENPPRFNNLASMLKHGINEAIILTIYFIIPSILILAGIASLFTQIDLEIPTLSADISFGLIILGILLGFVADIIVTVAVPYMASKSGALKDAFRLGEIFRKIRQIGLKRLLIAYLGVIIGVVVIAGPIFEEIIESVNIFGFVIGELIIAPYLLMFYARFIALIYRG